MPGGTGGGLDRPTLQHCGSQRSRKISPDAVGGNLVSFLKEHGDRARGQRKWPLWLYEAGGYVLCARGGRDAPEVDHKCLRISTHETTFPGCFSGLSLSLTLSRAQVVRRPLKNVATSTSLIHIGALQAVGQPSGLKKNMFLLLSLLRGPERKPGCQEQAGSPRPQGPLRGFGQALSGSSCLAGGHWQPGEKTGCRMAPK